MPHIFKEYTVDFNYYNTKVPPASLLPWVKPVHLSVTSLITDKAVKRG